jgi:hypothetical protein
MPHTIDRARIESFIHEVARAVHWPTRVYFVGGATAVLVGWRESAVTLNVHCVGDEELGPTLSRLKESLGIPIGLASPDRFIPQLPGWEERSIFIVREGAVDFFHYDPYSQALAKLERGFSRDLEDVREMFARGLVDPEKLVDRFEAIVLDLPRYPAIDAESFAAALDGAIEAVG